MESRNDSMIPYHGLLFSVFTYIVLSSFPNTGSGLQLLDPPISKVV